MFVNVKLMNGDEIIGEMTTYDDVSVHIRNPCSIIWKSTSTGESMNLYRYNTYSLDCIVGFNKANVISMYEAFKNLSDYYERFIVFSDMNMYKVQEQLNNSTTYLDQLIAKTNSLESKIDEPVDDYTSSYYDWMLDNLDPPTDAIN